MDSLPEKFLLGVSGRIVRRQTTFWDVVVSDSNLCRIHFNGKQESSFHAEEFQGLAVYDDHPLLMDYLEEWRSIYISSATTDADVLVARLSEIVSDLTKGWRSINQYSNTSFDAAEILRTGSGLLLAGPLTLVNGILPTLSECGIVATTLEGKPISGSPQVLIMGSNFVIANSFKVEPHANEELGNAGRPTDPS